uniref:Uncharacterized protein n=1 Tax=Gopherus evgoodei TaxID=1825980 RepID=A0A8C4WDF6_9SAUR
MYILQQLLASLLYHNKQYQRCSQTLRYKQKVTDRHMESKRWPSGMRTLAKSSVESLTWTGWSRHKFTKSRMLASVFQPRSSDHEKYGGDPQQPHTLHLVTRIKSENSQMLLIDTEITLQ